VEKKRCDCQIKDWPEEVLTTVATTYVYSHKTLSTKTEYNNVTKEIVKNYFFMAVYLYGHLRSFWMKFYSQAILLTSALKIITILRQWPPYSCWIKAETREVSFHQDTF